MTEEKGHKIVMERSTNLKELIATLKSYQKVCVAFSGGVDSSLILAAAMEALGKDNVMAVTAKGIMTSEEAYQTAVNTALDLNANLMTVEIDAFLVPAFVNNSTDRCYHCKKAIFTKMVELSKNNGFDVMVEGSNLDDKSKYRPGKKAIEELGVKSPLSNFSKEEIRTMAKELSLPVWKRPSESCYATRFPYETTLTREMFAQVAKAEEVIKKAGVTQCRVRVHGEIARVEVLLSEMEIVIKSKLYESLKELGFKYVTLDLGGFRSGSMDE